MIAEAKGVIDEMTRTTSSYHTVFKYQIEDGAKLEGIADKTVDVVLSSFGMFLVKDKTSMFHNIKRVLKEGGIIAVTAWFGEDLYTNEWTGGNAVSFYWMRRQVSEALNRTIEPSDRWESPSHVESAFASANIKFLWYRSFHHNVAWPSLDELLRMWTTMVPLMSTCTTEPQKDEHNAIKNALEGKTLQKDGGPILMHTSAFVALGKMV